MTAELEIPPEVDPNAADLIRKLLDRNPETRLQDPAQIKAHPWFADIDWEALYNRQITPPYKPPVVRILAIRLSLTKHLELPVNRPTRLPFRSLMKDFWV